MAPAPLRQWVWIGERLVVLVRWDSRSMGRESLYGSDARHKEGCAWTRFVTPMLRAAHGSGTGQEQARLSAEP